MKTRFFFHNPNLKTLVELEEDIVKMNLDDMQFGILQELGSYQKPANYPEIYGTYMIVEVAATIEGMV